MFWRSKLNIALFILPFILLWPLFYAASWRPHAFSGHDGPAPLDAMEAGIAQGLDGTLVCAPVSGTLQLYDNSENGWRFIKTPHSRLIPEKSQTFATRRLIFSRDSKTLFAPVQRLTTVKKKEIATRTIQAFDLKSGQPIYTFGNPTSAVFDISPDGKWAAFANYRDIVILDLSAAPLPRTKNRYDVIPEPLLKTQEFRDYPSRRIPLAANARALNFSPDSKTLAAGFSEQISLYDVVGNSKNPTWHKQIERMPSPNNPSQANLQSPLWLQWAPDGTKLASYSSTEIAIFDAELDKVASASLDVNLITGNETDYVVANVAWAPDSSTLVTSGAQAKRWRLVSGKTANDGTPANGLALKQEASYETYGAVTLSNDGKYLIASRRNYDSDYSVWQWRIR